MTHSKVKAELNEDSIDIESIRRETTAILQNRLDEALDRYVGNTILGTVAYSIPRSDTSIYSMYVSFCFIERTMEIKDIKIVVHRQRWNDPYLEIAICHELGHLDNALRSKNKKFIDPGNSLQKLYVEIMADRKAADIYGGNEGNKIVGKWLKYSTVDCIKNYKRAVSKTATARSLLLFLIRYIAHVFPYRQKILDN